MTRAGVKVRIRLHQPTPKGVFDLFGPPKLGGPARFLLAHERRQVTRNRPRIDQSTVDVEADDGIGTGLTVRQKCLLTPRPPSPRRPWGRGRRRLGAEPLVGGRGGLGA